MAAAAVLCAGPASAQKLGVGATTVDGFQITGYGVSSSGAHVYLTGRFQVLQSVVDAEAVGLPIGTKTPAGAMITGYGVTPGGVPAYILSSGQYSIQTVLNGVIAKAPPSVGTPPSLDQNAFVKYPVGLVLSNGVVIDGSGLDSAGHPIYLSSKGGAMLTSAVHPEAPVKQCQQAECGSWNRITNTAAINN